MVQKSFVPLSVSQDTKNFPQKYPVEVVPTIYFINPKDGSVIEKILGYQDRKEFSEILSELAK